MNTVFRKSNLAALPLRYICTCDWLGGWAGEGGRESAILNFQYITFIVSKI
jgi:hypothetical protein